jgi:hypothetical protein
MLMRRLDPQVVGARREDGADMFFGGTEVARLAVAELIGDQAWREAVRDYIAGDDAAEMIRSVLHLVRPLAAAQECLRLWREGTGSERRCAIELLRVTAHPQMLALVPEFLADPDEEVQAWGAGVVDQLVWDGMAEPEQAEHCLQAMESHPAQNVRERAAFVRDYLAARERSAGPL